MPERRRARGGRGQVPCAGLLRRDPPGLRQPGAILAVEQYGAPLARPRLAVTGEVTGGRDVNDVVELDVVRVEPTGYPRATSAVCAGV
ncbi:hypothetical protein ACFYXQ_30950 [Nocardia jiangxiensis]|uniref:Uncharacterized protein n=1 Tax=Nocardia jiangxiensis TaxID=282685 RepID=A0ABW6SAK8_9NOCA